jgi:hypothetical protein
VTSDEATRGAGVDGTATRPRPIRELLFVAALFLAYKVGRLAVAGDLTAAYANAAHIWTLERLLRLPSEAALQQLVIGQSWLVRTANIYYAVVHFPATGALLLWTYLRRPAYYRWARTSLAALTASAFIVQVLVPLAPPRLLASAGMVDTAHLLGPSVYGNATANTLANQYAAMPSLHVGWAAGLAVVLIAATRSRWRWLWLLHPIVTLGVVLVTANHYWLDAIVALALLGLIHLVLATPARPAVDESRPPRPASSRLPLPAQRRPLASPPRSGSEQPASGTA